MHAPDRSAAEPPLPLGPMTPDGPLTWERRGTARGPVSPVAPRRTAVAAVLRSTDHSFPCRALLVSGISYRCGLHPQGKMFKR